MDPGMSLCDAGLVRRCDQSVYECVHCVRVRMCMDAHIYKAHVPPHPQTPVWIHSWGRYKCSWGRYVYARIES